MDPMPTAADLPDDPELLKLLVIELLQELEAKKRMGEQLQRQLEQVMRKLFGRKSEKLDPNQLQLILLGFGIGS